MQTIPFLIAGPCSAETPEQLHETAAQILQYYPQIRYLRAGIWKPRTRPGSFEGVGAEGLQWLAEVGKALGVQVITEVAKAEHVEAALKAGIDALWVGARSSTNPFTVQEIADALQGVDVPVFVKNPINPDVKLWAGAIERLQGAGLTELGAIHRGFSMYGSAYYRNEPLWHIPLEIKRLFPGLPLLCDPSHITGKRENVARVSQKAMDLAYDGLMIETHRDPENAWSDARQQLTPQALGEFLNELRLPEKTAKDPAFVEEIEELRQEIDQADRQLLAALAARMRIVDRLGDYKEKQNIAVFQLPRWQEIMTTRPEWAEEMQISPKLAQALFRFVHDESIRLQTQKREKNG